ncbi:putative protein kinase TKL-Pl-4 family [Helianthus annuus]|nr:putative protein kinase TKL-Pl-4 family [Helianthus annuus]
MGGVEDNEPPSKRVKASSRELKGVSNGLKQPSTYLFVAACRQPQVFCIITEYLSEGSLRAYLHKLEDNTGKERISSVRKAYPDGFKYYSWNGIHPFARRYSQGSEA